jgi:TolB-like protein
LIFFKKHIKLIKSGREEIMKEAIVLAFILSFLIGCLDLPKRKVTYIAGLRVYDEDEDPYGKEEPEKKQKAVPVLSRQMRIAIYDFNARGVSRAIAERVSNWIRTAMICDEFAILERTQMEKIFIEHRFVMTGCTDSDCAVKIGKMLSANKVLVGTVEKFGEKYIITGRLVDVEKGIAEFGHQERVNNWTDLDKCAAMFAENILRKMSK